MSLYVRHGGVWEDVFSGKFWVYDAGAWKQVNAAWVYDAGSWKKFFSTGTVTVSGESILASAASGPVNAQLLINTDGTLDKNDNGTVSQIDAGTDWIIPNSAASSDYEVRFTNLVGTPAGATTLTENIWAPIDQQHLVGVRRTGAEGTGQNIVTFTLEIRQGSSGAALDTGNFTLQAEIT